MVQGPRHCGESFNFLSGGNYIIFRRTLRLKKQLFRGLPFLCLPRRTLPPFAPLIHPKIVFVQQNGRGWPTPHPEIECKQRRFFVAEFMLLILQEWFLYELKALINSAGYNSGEEIQSARIQNIHKRRKKLAIIIILIIISVCQNLIYRLQQS